jgi:hypothetical protein
MSLLCVRFGARLRVLHARWLGGKRVFFTCFECGTDTSNDFPKPCPKGCNASLEARDFWDHGIVRRFRARRRHRSDWQRWEQGK